MRLITAYNTWACKSKEQFSRVFNKWIWEEKPTPKSLSPLTSLAFFALRSLISAEAQPLLHTHIHEDQTAVFWSGWSGKKLVGPDWTGCSSTQNAFPEDFRHAKKRNRYEWVAKDLGKSSWPGSCSKTAAVVVN